MVRHWLPFVFVVLILLSGSIETFAKVEDAVCKYNPMTSELLENTNLNKWIDWIEKLSGAEPVQISGLNTYIQTRETRLMFTDQPHARAYDYVLEQTRNWYPDANITQHEYDIFDIKAENLIVTLPGVNNSDEIILLSAHLDAFALNSPIAPGANDNGTGSATLLEAARIFRQFKFDRTIQLVWFTGEEDGLTGSGAFVRDYSSTNFKAVINMDMFGWDGDGDRCFDIHTDSNNPGSQMIGDCFADLISAYNLDLLHEFVDKGRSDQVTFQNAGISAVGIHENVTDNHLEDKCIGTDMNSHLHSIEDTVNINLTPGYAFDIAQAGLATVMELATPMAACFTETIQLSLVTEPPESVLLQWNSIPDASAYRVYRSNYGCEGSWQVIGETTNLDWQDTNVIKDWPYQYQVEAIGSDGVCVSQPSNCVLVGPQPPPVYERLFLPLIL